MQAKLSTKTFTDLLTQFYNKTFIYLKDKKWGSKVPTLPDQEFHSIEDFECIAGGGGEEEEEEDSGGKGGWYLMYPHTHTLGVVLVELVNFFTFQLTRPN